MHVPKPGYPGTLAGLPRLPLAFPVHADGRSPGSNFTQASSAVPAPDTCPRGAPRVTARTPPFPQSPPQAPDRASHGACPPRR